MRGHLCVLLALALVGPSTAHAQTTQTTTFTYQGQLTDAGAPANGNYDFVFTLFDAAAAGTQIGAPLTRTAVAVNGGVFTAQLDFGVNAFPGADRFLQIGVRPAGAGSFTTLAARQQISSTPYAVRTLSAATADALSTTCTACVQDAQIKTVTGSKVTGSIPVASVPAGSGNYIQNTTAPQAGANFNVGGSGTIGGDLTVAGTLNANVGGNFIQNRTTPQTNTNFNVSGNGTLGGTLSASKVGVGTTTPATPLDVRGNVTLDSGADPIVYTGTSNTEQNRYVNLINSPAAPSASGMKAGGVLVADSFAYANPGKNDLIVKGNAGVGTAAPEAKLHINGRTGLGTPFRGLTIDQTLLSTGSLSGYSLQIRTTDQTVAPFSSRTDLLIDSLGNMGLGTETPTSKLEIAGSQPSLTLRDTNAGGARGIVASGNGDLSFYPNSSIGGAAALTVKNGTGNVGIGTTAPTAARLQVNDTSVGTAVFGTTSTIGSGVYGQSTGAGGYGVYGNSPSGYAMFANGNAGQARDKGGWVKAMACVLENGTIDRCYNGTTGASLTGGTSDSGCGFDVVKDNPPLLGPLTEVFFGFTVGDRFVSVTPDTDSTGHNIGVNASVSADEAEVSLFYADEPQNRTNAPFCIFVF
jgi:hypothetical protein